MAELEEKEEVEETDEVELDEAEVEEAEASLAATEEDEEDSEEASLEALLAQRGAGRRTGAADESDEDDIMALSSQKEPAAGDVTSARVIPIKDRQEFVCQRCHLVKARSQLADAQRGLCRDCA